MSDKFFEDKAKDFATEILEKIKIAPIVGFKFDETDNGTIIEWKFIDAKNGVKVSLLLEKKP